MLEPRNQWIKKRFGNIDEKILGNIEDVKKISWPDIVKEYEVKGNKQKWQMVRDIEESAERVAEIYRNGIDELVGNSEYDWHQSPEEIIKRIRTGDYNIYGCYLEDKLVSVVSMHIIQGQKAIQWMGGC